MKKLIYLLLAFFIIVGVSFFNNLRNDVNYSPDIKYAQGTNPIMLLFGSPVATDTTHYVSFGKVILLGDTIDAIYIITDSLAVDIAELLASKQDTVLYVSNTEIGYLNGVTSAIQTQIDGKEEAHSTITTDGDTLKFTAVSVEMSGNLGIGDNPASAIGLSRYIMLGGVGAGSNGIEMNKDGTIWGVYNNTDLFFYYNNSSLEAFKLDNAGNHLMDGELFQDGAYNYGADAQADNDYEISLPSVISLTTGMTVTFKANTTNTGSATFEITEVGDIDAILKMGDLPLTAGDIQAGDLVELKFDATNWQMSSPPAITTIVQTIYPTNAVVADTNVISPSVTSVNIGNTTYDANDFIVLPAITSVPVGHEIIIVGNSDANCELRTVAGSNIAINNVDADGDQEYLITDANTVFIHKVSDTYGWTAHDFDHVGAIVAAHVPN